MESKIEITRRLQSEGRWDEASACRDEERMRLRREGLTRREANERAWAWMIEQFAPLSEAEIRWLNSLTYLAMAENPVRHPALNAAGEIAFDAAWWVTCYMLARDEQLRMGSLARAETIEQAMVSKFASPEVAVLGTCALLRPGEFLQGIGRRFDSAIERLKADSTIDGRLLEEVTAVRDKAAEVAERRGAAAVNSARQEGGGASPAGSGAVVFQACSHAHAREGPTPPPEDFGLTDGLLSPAR